MENIQGPITCPTENSKYPRIWTSACNYSKASSEICFSDRCEPTEWWGKNAIDDVDHPSIE
jgi:hypothetical protein